jgi:hypothetical protein
MGSRFGANASRGTVGGGREEMGLRFGANASRETVGGGREEMGLRFVFCLRARMIGCVCGPVLRFSRRRDGGCLYGLGHRSSPSCIIPGPSPQESSRPIKKSLVCVSSTQARLCCPLICSSTNKPTRVVSSPPHVDLGAK